MGTVVGLTYFNPKSKTPPPLSFIALLPTLPLLAADAIAVGMCPATTEITMIHLIAAALALFVTSMLAIAGVDWITLGYGLNPWIAFPCAAVFGLLGYWQVQVGVNEYQLAEEYHTSKR